MLRFVRWVAPSLAALCLSAAEGVAVAQSCAGDCNGDGAVRVSELVLGVNVALGRILPEACPAADRGDGSLIGIAELIAGVVNSAGGCPENEQFVARASDFECLTSWDRVRRFRIANKLGHLGEALAVARGEAPLPYPPGTIIQLVPNEAMVKRGGGYDSANNDWEYFVIDPAGGANRIVQRGRSEVVNGRSPPCFACHNAARAADFICETTNGCIELNLPGSAIDFLQENDPRCR
jgi:hypothetical protein